MPIWMEPQTCPVISSTHACSKLSTVTPLVEYCDINADVQWISDDISDARDPQLWVIGTRLNLYL
ncbi:MAG: hypothetical protein PVI50_02445 [Gammaproteobacteria bacterium]